MKLVKKLGEVNCIKKKKLFHFFKDEGMNENKLDLI